MRKVYIIILIILLNSGCGYKGDLVYIKNMHQKVTIE
jgi:uncharacterized protein YceK